MAFPRSTGMQAIAVRSFRAPPELIELPKPVAGPGELLVRVGAAGVNPYDAKIAEGILASVMPHRFPLVLGVDGAGTVEAVGPGVTRFASGDRVFGQFLHAPVGTGTYCEYTTVPQSNAVARIPSRTEAVEAAAIPTAGMTALHALDTLGLARGQTLLVVGASGGVGSFAVQLAASRGLRVIALTRAASSDYVRSLGATEVVARDEPDAVERIRRSHPDGVDGLLDLASSSAAFPAYAALVRSGGIAGTTVHAAPDEAPPGAGTRTRNIDLTPSAALLDRIGTEVAAGRVRVPVRAVRPLADAPQVLTRIRGGGAEGKTVLTIGAGAGRDGPGDAGRDA